MPTKRVNRIAAIEDPAQRAAARRIGEVLDLFSDKFAAIVPAETRLLAVPGTADGAGRVRNAMRPLAIGAIGRLLLDLGVRFSRLHGREAASGCTEIVEMANLHPQTIIGCIDTFDALRRDRSEIGRLVADRYSTIVGAARTELEAAGIEARPVPRNGRGPRPANTAPKERGRVAKARARAGVKVLGRAGVKAATARRKTVAPAR